MLMTAFVQFRPEGHWELEFQFSENSNKKNKLSGIYLNVYLLSVYGRPGMLLYLAQEQKSAE